MVLSQRCDRSVCLITDYTAAAADDDDDDVFDVMPRVIWMLRVSKFVRRSNSDSHVQSPRLSTKQLRIHQLRPAGFQEGKFRIT